MNLYKPKDLIALLKNLKISPKKSLSQNFLIDQNIIKKILKIADIQKDDVLLEIGPGAGALTQALCKKGNVIAIEKDKTFAKHIRSLGIEVYEKDFLSFPLEKITKKKIKVISNIPYHISSPIIVKLLKNYKKIEKMILMLQYEFAKRIVAKKNTKDYSAFSLFVNFYANPKIEFKVSKNSFFPKPKVSSCIVSFEIKKNIPNIEKEAFHRFVQKAFSKRRKKISSFLKMEIPKELQNLRPENLSLEDFLYLFKQSGYSI